MDKQYNFEEAILTNNTEIVEILLNDLNVKPDIDNSFAIQYSAEHNQIEIVKLLLDDERNDPSSNGNFAINVAQNKNHFDIVNLLWNDKRVKNTLKKNNLNLYKNLKKIDKLKAF